MIDLKMLTKHGAAPLVILLVVGPLSYLSRDGVGLAWGLGWGLAAALAWSLAWRPAWGLVWGLSAGLYVGLDTGALLGFLGNLTLGGLAWGLAAGLVGRLSLGLDRNIELALREVFYGAVILPFLGGGVVAALGALLDDFSLGSVDFVLGIFFGLFWGLGGVLGIWLGHLLAAVNKEPKKPVEFS